MRQLNGKHSVSEALHAGTALDRIVVDKTKRDRFQDLLAMAKDQGIKVQALDKKAFSRHYGDSVSILAFSSKKSAPQTISPEPASHPFILVLDHIQDPHNMGAIIRTAAGLGVNAILYPKDRSCQITDTVIKVSSGATECIPLIQVTNLAREIDSLKDKGYWIYGADSNQGSELSSVSFNAPAVLIAGSEGKGISSLLSKKLDQAVYIPMNGQISSLNVSVATGIILHTILDQISH